MKFWKGTFLQQNRKSCNFKFVHVCIVIEMLGFLLTTCIKLKNLNIINDQRRRNGLMVRVLDFGLGCLGLSLGWGHCIVLLGKTLYSHNKFTAWG